MALKRVVLGGGTGFIGSALTSALRMEGISVTIVSRTADTDRLTWNEIESKGLPPYTTDVINLAGENAFNPRSRWNKKFKEEIWDSRVNTTKILAKAVSKSDVQSFVTISGVGYYPPSDTRDYTEYDKCEPFDYFSEMVHAWEAAGDLPAASTCRRVIIRSGIVLGRRGGMIKQAMIPFYLGLGGTIGNGKQYMPWIHIDDLVEMFIFAIREEKVKGVLNGVSPEKITNRQFSTAFGKAMWRPAIIPVPQFALNLLFSSERGKIMTESQRVYPKRALEYDFKYAYSNIDDACRQFGNIVYSHPY